MTFYHGGTPGLVVGTTLVPRPDLADAVAYERARTRGLDPLRKQRVYFTDSLGWAWVYARFYEERFGVPGAVYEVMPCGKIEKDTSERVPPFACSAPRPVSTCRRSASGRQRR